MPKVLIAEDDLLMADMLEDVLLQRGYDVCGIASTVDKAVELGERHRPDLAILDIRLADGGLGTDIPARLKSHGRMGVLYASGQVGQLNLTKSDGDALIMKPYLPADVIRALKIVEQMVGSSEAIQRYPRGFSVLQGSPNETAAQNPVVDEVNRQLGRLHRRQQALARFGTFALAERDIGKILMEAANVCAECMGVPYCTVYRYRPDENDLLAVAWVGWDHGVMGRVISPADGNSPHGRAFVTRGPLICRELATNTSFVRSRLYAEHGIMTALDVTIANAYHPHNLPYGVLEIDSRDVQNYDQHDIDFLTGIANILAAALHATTRDAHMQIVVDQLQDVVGDRDHLNSTASALVVEKSRLVAEKDVLVNDVQYRVRSDLQLVCSMLSGQLQPSTDAARIDGISAIVRRVVTLAEIYDHTLRTGQSRAIDLGTYLPSLCTHLEILGNRQSTIKLTCPSEPVVLALDGVSAVGLAVSELIANSHAHAPPGGGGSISLSLSSGQPGEGATITFADDGLDLADVGDSNQHGLGFVHRLMEQIGGSATTLSDHGTMCTLHFPVPPAPGDGAAPAPASA